MLLFCVLSHLGPLLDVCVRPHPVTEAPQVSPEIPFLPWPMPISVTSLHIVLLRGKNSVALTQLEL